MKTVIFLCGIYSGAFAVFHVLFWRLFNWKKELVNVSAANRAIVQILNSRLIYIFLFTAFICFVYPEELLYSSLGKAFLAGMSLFWMGRTIEQFVFLNINNRWVHLLTIIFAAGSILFALPLILSH